MSACMDTYRGMFPSDQPYHCHRLLTAGERHRGDHQAFRVSPPHKGDPEAQWSWERDDRPSSVSIMSWGQGGAHGSAFGGWDLRCQRCKRGQHDITAHTPRLCIECGALYDPAGHDRRGYPGRDAMCFGCALWDTRAEDYAKPGTHRVRPHNDVIAGGSPSLYGWAQGHGGAFGGRRFKVTWDDGREAGPADFLWHGGTIPWWMLDRFPPNANVTATHGTEIRPGYTDSIGRPLDYTGHPVVAP